MTFWIIHYATSGRRIQGEIQLSPFRDQGDSDTPPARRAARAVRPPPRAARLRGVLTYARGIVRVEVRAWVRDVYRVWGEVGWGVSPLVCRLPETRRTPWPYAERRIATGPHGRGAGASMALPGIKA